MNFTKSNLYKDKSKKRLKKIIEKKFLTSMISSLAEFEQEFGDLWGHGKTEETLTEDELDFRDRWEDCRNRILNSGNRQKRNALTEIDMHEISWLRYNVTLLPTDIYNKKFPDKNGNAINQGENDVR